MLKQLLVTFFACAFFCASTTAQQTIVQVNSPSNIAGSYIFANAFDSGWGADLTTGIWTADAVLTISTGATAPTNQGCDSLINGADLAGKIAFVDRGTCNFSLKALNAQKAGAIACIIVNNVPSPPVAAMGAGTFGAQVTIPVVMVSQADGANIKDEIAMGPVNMTIGTFSFANDIGSKNGDILRNPNGVMPALQAVGANATFQPGALITNLGTNDATNVVLSTAITFTPAGSSTATNVFSGSETADLLEVDSSVLIGPDEFTTGQEPGTYTVNYNMVSDVDDEFEMDNSATTSFILSENVYSKAGWDAANKRPARTNAYTISGGGSIEFFSGFRIPLGSGYKIDSVQFYVATAAASLDVVGASNITPYVYEWDDANADGLVTNDEITIVAIGLLESFPNPAATAEWLKLGLLDFETLEPGGYIIPDDNKTYFVGTRYTGTETVFFGMDENYDQNVYWNFIAPTAADLSYFIVNVWDDIKPDIENDLGFFTDLFASASIGLYINQVENNVGENNPEIGSFELFPNPTSSLLNVETKFAKTFTKVDYTIVSADGSVVGVISRDVNGSTDNVSLPVAHLPAGQYFLNVNTVDGSVSRPFSVQR